MRKPERVHVFYLDEKGQAKIVPWRGLMEQPCLCRQVFNIKKEDLKELYDDSQAPYQYGDEVDRFLAKTWYQNALAEGNDRILAMAKVDAAAKFVYLQEHQAWCELPLRVLCHGLALGFPEGDLQKIEATNKLMKAYVETWHQKEAAQLGEEMLPLPNLDDWNKAKLKTNLGWVYKEWQKPEKAEEHLQESLDIVNKCYDAGEVREDDRDLQTARILNNLGPVLADLKCPKEALTALEKCWELFKIHVGKDGSSKMKNLLEELEKRDRGKQAALTEVQFKTGYDLLKKYPEVATCLNNLGSAYGKLGMYERQSKQLEICMLLQVGYYGNDHPKVAAVLTNLSLVRQKELQFRAAKTYLKRSLRLHEMHFGKVHEHVAEVMCNLAVVCAKLKEEANEEADEEADEESDDPDEYLDRCDEILEQLGKGHDVLSAKIKNNRAILHMWRGDLEDATEKFLESQELLGNPEESPELFIEFAEIWHNLGEVLLETVEKNMAKNMVEKTCNDACVKLHDSIRSFEKFRLKLEELKLPCDSLKFEQVSSWKLLAKAYLTLEKFDDAKEQLKKVRKILAGEYEQSNEQVHLVEVLHYEAVIEYKLKNFDGAKTNFEDCLKEAEKHEKGIKKEFMIQINSNLAHTCRSLRAKDAKENDDSRKKSLEEREELALQFCVDLLESLHEKPLESDDYLQHLTRLGLVEVDRKKYEDAACHLELSLQSKLKKIQGQDCKELAQIVMIVDALGFVYYAQSPPNISKEKEMLEYLIRFKADGEKISRILKRLRAACMKGENIESRIKSARELLATCKDKELGEVEHAHVLLCLARTFLEKHDLNEVKTGDCSEIPNLCRKILELDKDENMELLKSLSETWLWLGEEYVSKEMYEDARSVLEECLHIKHDIFGTDVRKVEVAKVHLELGPVYRILGNATMAKEMLELVLNSQPPPCSDKLDLATAWGDLGLVYCDEDDFENAKKCFTECWKKKKPEDLEVVVHNLAALHHRFNRAFKKENWSKKPLAS